MGACETTPATSHARGTHASDLPYIPQPRERLFLAPHHRPPLAGIKLVRPRPAPGGAALRALQLDPVRATAQIRSDEEKPHHSPRPARRPQGKVTG